MADPPCHTNSRPANPDPTPYTLLDCPKSHAVIFVPSQQWDYINLLQRICSVLKASVDHLTLPPSRTIIPYISRAHHQRCRYGLCDHRAHLSGHRDGMRITTLMRKLLNYPSLTRPSAPASDLSNEPIPSKNVSG